MTECKLESLRVACMNQEHRRGATLLLVALELEIDDFVIKNDILEKNKYLL